MERTYINSLFDHTKSLPLEVSLEQATEWVNIQARTPAGKSNSWFNFLNSIIMVGIIIAIGALILTPNLSQPETMAHSLTPKTPLEIPLEKSLATFAIAEPQKNNKENSSVVFLSSEAEATYEAMVETPETISQFNEPIFVPEKSATPQEPANTIVPSGVIEPQSDSWSVYATADDSLEEFGGSEVLASEVVASSHQVSLFSDGHTGDWNNSVSTAKENGLMLNACKLKRNRKGIVKKLDLSVMAKRPQTNYSYRGFLRISTNNFDRIDFAWDLMEDGTVSNFRYSIDEGEEVLIEDVHKSCCRVKCSSK